MSRMPCTRAGMEEIGGEDKGLMLGTEGVDERHLGSSANLPLIMSAVPTPHGTTRASLFLSAASPSPEAQAFPQEPGGPRMNAGLFQSTSYRWCLGGKQRLQEHLGIQGAIKGRGSRWTLWRCTRRAPRTAVLRCEPPETGDRLPSLQPTAEHSAQ